MKNTKQAFTLVELIVVITILAILGTIAFISLQGYSADARNSKRTDDLNKIITKMNLASVDGVSFDKMVTEVADSQVTSADFGGQTGVTAGSDTYNAGTVNFVTLGMKGDDFQDPQGGNYVAGYTKLSGGEAGSFELAAKLEKGTDEGYVKGNYNARAVTSVAVSTGTTTGFVLGDTNANMFRKGDVVKDTNSTTTGAITKVGADLVTIEVAGFTGVTAVELAAAESVGLVGEAGAGTGVVETGEAVLPY